MINLMSWRLNQRLGARRQRVVVKPSAEPLQFSKLHTQMQIRKNDLVRGWRLKRQWKPERGSGLCMGMIVHILGTFCEHCFRRLNLAAPEVCSRTPDV